MIRLVIPLLAALFILLPMAITQTVYADSGEPVGVIDPCYCPTDPADMGNGNPPPNPPDPVVTDPVNDDDHDDGDSYTSPVVDPPIRHIGICHATGSLSNPYVHIVVDESAVPAHRRHPGDIIGVNTPDQCPQAIVPMPTPRPPIGICHATGDVSKPYVHIMVEHKDRPQHDKHGKDIVGIPNPNDCPKPAVVIEPPIVVVEPPVLIPPVVVTEPPVVVVAPPAVTVPSPAPGIAAPPAQNVPTSVERPDSVPVTMAPMLDKVQATSMPKSLPRAGDGGRDTAYVLTGLALGLGLVLCSIAIARLRKANA